MPKFLVALDLDGTVLHEDESVDAELAAALQELDRATDVELVFATGRAVDAGVRIAEQLSLSPTWFVACNGAVTLRRDLQTKKLLPHTVRTFNAREMLLNVAERMPGAAIAVEGADGNFYYTAEMPGKTLPNNRFCVPFAKLLTITATRVVATSPAHSVAEFFAHLDELGYAHTAYSVGDTAWLDAAPMGVNKATALEPVRAELGILAQHIFAAGDGMNDIEMLRWAGVKGRAVAMGHAYPELKAAANLVTGTIAEGGLLQALLSFEPLQHILRASKQNW